MPGKINKTQLSLLVLVVGIFSAGLVWLSQKYYLADSELWAIALSTHWTEFNHSSHFYKFLFFFTLQLNQLAGADNLDTILASRAAFGFLAGLQVFGLVFLATKAFKNTKDLYLVLFLFLSSTFFYTEAIQVRSDNLVAFLQIISLIFLFKYQERKQKISLYFFIALNILIFFTSPKGILHILCNFLLFTRLNHENLQLRNLKEKIKKYRLVLFAILLAFLAVFAEPLKMAAYYFFSSFSSLEAFKDSWSAERFNHLFLFIKQNPQLLFLSTVALVISLRSKSRNVFTFPALLSWAFIFLHNDRLSFYIQSMMLFPVLHLTFVASPYLASRSRRTLLLATATAVLVSLNLIYHLSQRLSQGQNTQQIQALQDMESFFERYQSPLYYDATGVLPHGHQVLNFPTPDHPQNLLDIRLMFRNNPIEVVFWGNRLFNYFVPMNELLQQWNYIQISPGLFVKAKVLDLTQIKGFESLRQHCETANENLQLYRGNSFLETNWIGSLNSACKDLLANPPQEIIALTRFEPFEFQNKKPFSHIFDSNPGL